MLDGVRVDFWFLVIGKTIPGIIIGRRQSCLSFYKSSSICCTVMLSLLNVRKGFVILNSIVVVVPNAPKLLHNSVKFFY